MEKKDILLICSNGLHRRNTEPELRQILGPELFNQFWYTHQIINHDSEDYDHMVDLGTTDRGDPVLMNKYVYDSDVAILIGHTQGNPYGGYSGGYKHPSLLHISQPPRQAEKSDAGFFLEKKKKHLTTRTTDSAERVRRS